MGASLVFSTQVETTLLALKFAFLVLLYLFIWRIVRSAARDLRLPQESMILSPQQASQLLPQQTARELGRIVVVSSPALQKGGDLHWHPEDGVALRGTRLGAVAEKVASRDYTYLLLVLALVGHLEWFLYAAAAGSAARVHNSGGVVAAAVQGVLLRLSPFVRGVSRGRATPSSSLGTKGMTRSWALWARRRDR